MALFQAAEGKSAFARKDFPPLRRIETSTEDNDHIRSPFLTGAMNKEANMEQSVISNMILENAMVLQGQPKWTFGKNTCNT